MRLANTPFFTPRYWVAISIASIFGANLGDFASHNLGLGHWHGVPILALLFALILWAEARLTRPLALWYWSAVVLLRTAATNLADLATHDLKLSYPLFILALSLLFVLLIIPIAMQQANRPRTNGWYWAALLTAGTIGTAIGDYVSDDLGCGPGYGTIILGLITGAIFVITATLKAPGKPTYWLRIAAIRAAGTTAGDYLAFHHGADLGLPLSTLLSGLALIAILTLWQD